MTLTLPPEMDRATAAETHDTTPSGPAASTRAPRAALPLTVPLTQVHPSPHNARAISWERIASLADHMQRAGQLTRCLVRPMPVPPAGADPSVAHYELAAGHRRRAAAEHLGWDAIDVDVREMDDHTFLMALWAENLQRSDVPPLEEARGIAELQRAGWDLAAVAQEIGRPEAYVRGRLALLQLSDAGQEAMTRGFLPTTHAVEIAKLPAEVQDEALDNMFGLNTATLIEAFGAREAGIAWIGDVAESRKAADEDEVEDDPDGDGEEDEQFPAAIVVHPFGKWGRAPVVPLLAELRDVLRAEFYRRLRVVPWALDDATLLPAAGACNTCVKRSHATPSLFPELADAKGDACLDAGCFTAKRRAWERREAGEEDEQDEQDTSGAAADWQTRSARMAAAVELHEDARAQRETEAAERAEAEKRRKQREAREQAKAQRRVAVWSHARASTMRQLLERVHALPGGDTTRGPLKEMLQLAVSKFGEELLRADDAHVLEVLSIAERTPDKSRSYRWVSDELDAFAHEESSTTGDLLGALLVVAMNERLSLRGEPPVHHTRMPEEFVRLAETVGVEESRVLAWLTDAAAEKERQLDEEEAEAKRAAKRIKGGKKAGAKGNKSSTPRGRRPAQLTDVPPESPDPTAYPIAATPGTVLDGADAPYSDDLPEDED